MAKPEGWRLDLAAYPVILECGTRFQDMDINGHLNNVAFASLFENARVQLHRNARPWGARPENERTMVASVEINYLREGNFPAPVTIGSGIGRVGNSSWVVVQAMFQNGHCIATCDSVIVCRTDNEAKPLRAELVAELEEMLAKAV
ncbi:MAG: acyl-CoA thioesterase [Sphingomonadales bacterium]|jgi:acyl-CoA thioester hydrolase|nr:acyl-CoA thioesterase [Sphingomonadales bacterium]MBK9002725.1 acyl-CoA thioesterase [Sphingomonadales bacterium]MBK9267947.1 acyl-CoA thioesterase [Sphingomonadales bacterium]MBP6433419.1 acyl-CoA thioesterase [Sphingorhabdus sp.]